MAFVPNPHLIKIGDTVKINKNIVVPIGTFTAGHLFKVTGSGPRGHDLVDSDGRGLYEVSGLYMEKVLTGETETGPTVNTKEILALREIFPNATTKELMDGIFAVKNAT